MEDRLNGRIASLEPTIEDIEHCAKSLRELCAIEQGQVAQLGRHLQEIEAAVKKLAYKHQAEPALIAGIVSLGYSLLQQAALETVVTIPTSQVTASTGTNGPGVVILEDVLMSFCKRIRTDVSVQGQIIKYVGWDLSS